MLRAARQTAMPALRAAEMAEHGFLPLAGGWLAQTPACVQAIEMVQGLQAQMRLDALKRASG